MFGKTIPAGAKSDNERLVFVDGLRAIAAILVLFHHLFFATAMSPLFWRAFPKLLRFFSVYISHGVEIFFVISGFVIAHSLRNIEPTGRAIANFILRRQLRLDPPYWVTMAAMLALGSTKAAVLGVQGRGAFGAGVVLLNMAYLQNIAGVAQIVGVAWTLCLEIQFYLVFILILAVARKIPGDARPGKASVGAATLVFGLGVVSLACSGRQTDISLFVPYWFYFAAGALCYWSLKGGLHPMVFLSFAGLFAVATVWQNAIPAFPSQTVNAERIGLLTAGALFCAGKAGHLTDWLRGPVFRYFGRISYSLYLVHLPLVTLVMRIGYKVTRENLWAAAGWFVLAAASSLAGGQILCSLVEAPSMRLASRLKPGPSRSVVAGGALEEVGLNPGGKAITPS